MVPVVPVVRSGARSRPLVTAGGVAFPCAAAGGGQGDPGSTPVGSRSARSIVIAVSKSSRESNDW